jgi:hypothetical protein
LTQTEGWEIVVSAWWRKSEGQSKLERAMDILRERIDEDLRAIVVRVTSLSPANEWVVRFNSCVGSDGTGVVVAKNNTSGGIDLPQAFLIVSLAHSPPA